MSGIDWSKAPEGAQGYIPQSNLWVAGWWKEENGSRYFWSQNEGVQGEWRRSFASPFDRPEFIPRPSPAWSGEGLPPVGVECVCGAVTKHDPEPLPQWREGDIIKCAAHIEIPGAESLPLFWNSRTFNASTLAAHCYKPIRTPEQIAAELADQAIKKIATIICRDGAFDIHDPEVTESAVALYDAGLRFKEPSQ